MKNYFQAIGLLILAMVLMVGCTPQQVDTTAEARAAIAASNESFVSALKAGDAAAVAVKYTDDTVVLPPNHDFVNGPEAVQSLFQGLIDAGLYVELETVDVEGYGDIAIETGKATVFATGGQKVDDSKYIVVWKKVGTEWKMHRDMWNTSTPLPAPVED